MIDLYINNNIDVRTSLNVETPYRDFELIEFYKIVKSKNDIVAITIDEENHSISFILGKLKEGEDNGL